MEDGVWRTVGGRRIFIKEGEDLSTAMKKSGKFKTEKKEKQSKNTKKEEKQLIKTDEKFKNAPADIQKNISDIEYHSGIKVEDAFETNLYGMGKEDRFMLKDGSYIAHTKESFGQKEDSWSLNKDYDEKGNYNPQTVKFQDYNHMKNYLSRTEKGYGTSYKKYFDQNPNATFEDFEKDYKSKLK